MVTSYSRSNAHKSGIIDIVQIDNVKCKMRKEFEIGKEVSAEKDPLRYAPQDGHSMSQQPQVSWTIAL